MSDDSLDGAHDEAEKTPRWVKVFGSVLLAVVVVFVVSHLLGGGVRAHGGH